MIALGIDPGTLRLGWGVVSRSGNRLTHRAHGVIKMNAKLELSERLCRIETELSKVIETHAPEVSSVESLFFHKDAQAAAKLGHARGVVLLCLARAKVPIAEYAHLGEVMWEMGDRDAARSTWEGAAKQYPDNSVLTSVMRRYGL